MNQDPMVALYTARLCNVRALAAKEGGPVALADKLGFDQAWMSQLIGKNPSRNITERTARKIETTMALPIGSLDLIRASV
ncbi:hypothetical protein [Achromobacter pestifer]|uniref:Helix-turn-helix transcriptional regulator n=1 Tax=Achromobacter pestifer TaxID=1353889 RepID=A0A6S6Z190_9BURK|nr:hypothetical protein [Achromobacter pestifer]CAB3624585.1 hypothetical protein LMG3431_00038 [Achromobacter pestifer]